MPLNGFNNASFASAKDIFLAFPRLARKAGSFANFHFPEAVGDIRDMMLNGGSVIADATAGKTSATNTSVFLAEKTAEAARLARSSWTQGMEDSAYSMFGKLLEGVGKVKNLGGVFSYLTSRWALATFTAAIILNRAQFYASSREHLRLRWHTRLAIYSLPILAFLFQMQTILQAIRCQTSPDFAQLRYGDPLKELPMDFGGEGGFLYRASLALLWWQDDATCCAARRMSVQSLGGDGSSLKGSMSLLFGFFLTLCASQLFETLACALQGKQPVPETGMTLFEHSLAFAECEAMISSALGLGFFGLPKFDNAAESAPTDHSGVFLTRNDIIQRLNVPPEVLLVCLISCFSHLSSALLAVAGLRDKVRLINTGIWACCYMAAFLWSFLRVFLNPIQNITDLGVLRFPTVCIVGFIPHVLILVGILLCSIIYGAALLLTAVSVPENIARGMNFRQRLQWAYGNLQANVQFSQSSAIRIKMSEDFYTTILKIGFNVLTAASEAVYLNEGIRIQIAKSTWIERKRLDELASEVDRRNTLQIPSELLGEEIARGVEFVDHSRAHSSPYARERRSKPRTGDPDRMHAVEIDSGLGLTQRRSRMQLTFDFIASLFWLILGVLRRVAFGYAPGWLWRAAPSQIRPAKTRLMSDSHDNSASEFLMLDDHGRVVGPTDSNVDVEDEMRRLYQHQGTYEGEDNLSDRVYRWWSGGGWFGEADNSGDYQPSSADDDDVTSMISMSTNNSMDESSNAGDRTPTQTDPYGSGFRESTPDSDAGINLDHLSQLLNPASAGAREQARLLSYSLRSRRPLTRHQLRREVAQERSKLVRNAQHDYVDTDEQELEAFILRQREKAQNSKKAATSSSSSAWASGAEGMGDNGPQCVVCQSTPRTILVWPCGCLSMCDDCRIGLAARNFTQCVCCRTDVAAYSRLYVP